jgi:hypothetical protein
MMITLICSFSNNGPFVNEEAYSQSNDNTVRLSCFDVAIVLAVLDFSIELGDRESIDETLEESEIAPDLISVYTNLNNILDKVRDECHNEQDILQYANFSK